MVIVEAWALKQEMFDGLRVARTPILLAFLPTIMTSFSCEQVARRCPHHPQFSHQVLVGERARTSSIPLLNYHFSLETTFPLQSDVTVLRKRLTVPLSRMVGLVVHVVACYSADAETLYDRRLHTIMGFIVTPKVLASTHAPCRWTCATDLVILNCQQTLVAYQRCWQLNPADTESRDTMVTVAQHLTDLRQ
ncbi:hypothetical protein E2C01_033624 [Portunus trituberculatus]|uniref:Uncharacterized protein n=1 Tax=Portunus trituberculatus TaxID=210409 RepID=A0A5B7EYE4_PORTR|nr:hypothetical protein [Portunus trituberculatus]